MSRTPLLIVQCSAETSLPLLQPRKRTSALTRLILSSGLWRNATVLSIGLGRTFLVLVCWIGLFAVESSALADDHGDTRATASVIMLNSTTGGNLEVSGDEDFFRISIAGGTSGVLRVWTTGGTDTMGELFDSTGRTLRENDDVGNDLNLSLTENVSGGTYYVRISGFADVIGTYKLFSALETSPPIDDHGNTKTMASLINPNSTTSGLLETFEDDDFFRIDIVASVPGTLRIRTTGETDTTGELLNFRGETIGANDDSKGDSNFSLIQNVKAGTYYVRVRGYGGDAIAYQMVSSFTTGAQSDDYGSTQEAASLITANSTTSGNLEVSRDRDFFRIDVVTASTGTLRVFSAGGTNTIGELFDSSGQILSDDDDSGDAGNFLLTRRVSGGTYYLSVQGYDAAVGPYELRSSFQSDAQSDDHGNTQATASQINPNSTTSGNLEVSEDDDFFRIDILASVPGTLRIWTTGGTDTIGELFDSAGQAMGTNDDSGDDLNFFLIQNVNAGTYYVRVRGYDGDSKSYQIVSSFIRGAQPDDHGNTQATASLISPNSTTRVFLETSGDDDFFRIDVVAPVSGTLRVWTTGEMDTIGELFDSEGQSIGVHDNSSDGLNFSLVLNVRPGIYYIKVREYNQVTGFYQLASSFTRGVQSDDHGNTQATASLISANSTTRGNLETSGDDDFFRIDVVAPVSGTLRVWTTGETDTIGKLLTSNGQTLEENDDAEDSSNFSLIRRVTTGTYYVRIQEFKDNLGEYKVFSSFDADDHGNTQETASLISPKSTTSGNLEVFGDEDFFRIDIVEPSAGTLRVWTTGEMDTVGELFDSAGQSLVGNDDAADKGNFLLTQNVSIGTYYVRVQNYGGGTGVYQILSSFSPTSNPEISADAPLITNFDLLRGQLTFTEISRALSYRVEWSSTMAPGSWSSEAPGVAVIKASGANEQTVAIGIIPSPCFYRVVAVLAR
jgi:hypothetical protein